MTFDEIRMMVEGPEYDFLRTNEHLKDKIIFLTLGGSYAYGTNVATSDVDVRGCALNSPTDLLGMTNFEQVIDNGTDTTIYSFNKLVSLLVNCNPNTIELLGCKPDQYFMVSEIGREMISHQEMFLSQRAVKSFGGYATQQLRRLENALARDALPQARKEQHLLNSMKGAKEDIEKKYLVRPEGEITLYIDESEREDFDVEIFADMNLRRVRARDFCSLINEFKNVLDTYEGLGKRNKKKDAAHLNKHAMHLIRLYLMCLDILEKQQVVTYREAEHDLLMSIRNGEYMKEDGTYRDEFFQMVTDFEKKIDYAKQNTALPAHPNMKRIQEFVMSVNRRSI